MSLIDPRAAETVKIDRQIIEALDNADIAAANAYLDGIQKILDDKRKVLKQALHEPTENSQEFEVRYQYSGEPSRSMLPHLKHLRKGRIRKINRLVEVSPIWALCIGEPGDAPENRFRVLHSEEAAIHMKALHNV